LPITKKNDVQGIPMKRKWKCVTNIFKISATQSEDFNEVMLVAQGHIGKHEIQYVSLYKGFSVNTISNVLRRKPKLIKINFFHGMNHLLFKKVNIVLIHNLKTY
jgi:hypothetical protein